VSVLLGSSIFSVTASELFKWEDEYGNVTYQDSPPPSDVSFEEQTYTDPNQVLQESLSRDVEEAAHSSPVILFTVPTCDACDLVRLYLEQSSIPFTEKNIQNNVTLQQELKSLADELRVPTLAIGDELIDGYSKSAMRNMLIDKGYPIEQMEAGVAPLDGAGDEEFQAEGGSENLENLTNEELAELENLEEQISAEISDGAEFDLFPEGEVDTQSEIQAEIQAETQ